MIENIQSICVNTAYACAAGVGTVVVAYGVARGMKFLSGGVKCLAAVSLAGSLIFGGMVVTSVHVAGAKTNDTNQIENEELKMENAGGASSILHSPFSILHSNRLGSPPPTVAFVTDDDIAFGWRVASVSSNVLAASTFTMPPHATVWEDARDFGAGWGSWKIPLDGWHFTYGDVGWTNGFAWVEGYFRSKFRSRANEIRLLSERLALCPAANWSRYNLAASRAWCATNDVDGLVVTFENAAIGDDPTKIASVQMELFPRTGEVALRYDLANVGDATYTAGLVVDGTNHFVEVGAGTREVVFQRVHPQDWDMDGIPNSIDDTPRDPSLNTGYNQTDAWAMAAFPSNATGIATMGYAAWAAARAADPNRRLIGLHISSPDNVWPVCLTFGDLQVMCDGRQEVVFAIDCGAHYPFSISDGGELEFLTLHANVDDTQPCSAYGYPYERWADDVVAHLESPGSGWIGRTAEVSVDWLDGSHFHPGDSKIVTAVVTNCHEDAYIDCEWSGGDGIMFSDSHSLNTTVYWNSTNGVAWATNHVDLVTTYEGGYAVTNHHGITVGPQTEPTTEFTIGCQKVFFLNDADFLVPGECPTNRPERIRPVELRLIGPRGTGGHVSVVNEGAARAVLFQVEDGVTNRIDGETRIRLDVDGDSFARECVKTVYMSCPVLGRGTLRATWGPDEGEGDEYSSEAAYQVIEPIRKLVSNQRGGIFGQRQLVNPSRLVGGSTAVLCVGVNVGAGDSFALTNIHWEVRGPGRKVQTIDRDDMNLRALVVESTASTGVVEAVARFNGDDIQPKFVLPVVPQRVIPIRIFMVKPPKDKSDETWDTDSIMTELNEANYIFQQVGIRFELQNEITTVPNSSDKWNIKTDWIEHYWDWSSGWPRRKERFVMSQQPRQLYNHYLGNDCVEVYYLGSISSAWNPNTVANHNEGGILISKGSTITTLAHELGHVFGLWDCFAAANNGKGVPMSNHDNCLSRGGFASARDWGAETGRGFYGKSDTVSLAIFRLLMTGYPNGAYGLGMDIPDGMVKAVRLDSGTTGEGEFIPVGALQIEPDNGKVFSK